MSPWQIAKAMRPPFAAAALLLAGCLYPPHPLVGASCELEEDCGAGLVCLAGACRMPGGQDGGADGGERPQLLSNGTFSEGAIDWLASGETVMDVVEGGRNGKALRLSAPEPLSGNYLGASTTRLAISPIQSDRAYCAEFWVQALTAPSYIRLTLRRYHGSSWEDESGSLAQSFGAGWVRLTGRIFTTAPYADAVNLRVHALMEPGVSFLLDDVRVWEEAPGGCD